MTPRWEWVSRSENKPRDRGSSETLLQPLPRTFQAHHTHPWALLVAGKTQDMGIANKSQVEVWEPRWDKLLSALIFSLCGQEMWFCWSRGASKNWLSILKLLSSKFPQGRFKVSSLSWKNHSQHSSSYLNPCSQIKPLSHFISIKRHVFILI